MNLIGCISSLSPEKAPAGGEASEGINEDFRELALPPPCYSDKAEQAGAEEEEGSRLRNSRNPEGVG